MAGRRIVMDAMDREFWLLISQAAFSNPFSEQRYDLDLKIAGSFEGEAERVARLKKAVCDRVQHLERQGQAHLRHFAGTEREVMRIGFLFESFHRFYEEFDELILQQTKAGETSCRVPFASDALALLASR